MMANKFDEGKPRIDLLPSAALMEVAKILTVGLQKYGANNWREGEGFEWHRLYGAGERHGHAWNDGEDNDTETGLSHIAHRACCDLFLLEYILKGYGTDTRFKTDSVAKTQEQEPVDLPNRYDVAAAKLRQHPLKFFPGGLA
jgi:hypothetical protein